MTLAELAQAVDVPPRQIRYMIAEGCLPPAATTGRAQTPMVTSIWRRRAAIQPCIGSA